MLDAVPVESSVAGEAVGGHPAHTRDLNEGAGAIFLNGKLVERPDDPDQQGGGQQAAKTRRSTGLDLHHARGLTRG